jgi:hypothetical protein
MVRKKTVPVECARNERQARMIWDVTIAIRSSLLARRWRSFRTAASIRQGTADYQSLDAMRRWEMMSNDVQ